MANNTLTTKDCLMLPMQPNDANARTIGQYLIKLAQQCWVEEEGFSGKRPFGNSGWQHDVTEALITNNVIDGDFDEDGYAQNYDHRTADQVVMRLFNTLLNGDFSQMPEYQEPKDWYAVYLGLSSNAEPALLDSFWEGRTEEDAKSLVAEKNKALDVPRWIAVHIPS